MTQSLQPLPDNPTPQDFGFPEHPTAAQIRCWANQERFLNELAKHGIVGAACVAAGVPVPTQEQWESQDTNGFKRRKASVLRLALGVLELEIHRRAVEGVDKPVIYKGQITDTYREYSDNLLMFRTKRLDPAYKDNYDARPPVQPIQITRIIVHGVDPAAVETYEVVAGGVAPLPSGPVVEGETGDEVVS